MSDPAGKTTATVPNVEKEKAQQEFREGPAQAIRAALDASATVESILSSAQFALAARADKFTQEVGVKAVDIADKRKASAVDGPDVEAATQMLFPEKQGDGVPPWKWAVIGVAFGALVSLLITLLAPKLPSEAVPYVVVLSIIAIVGFTIWTLKLIIPRKRKV